MLEFSDLPYKFVPPKPNRLIIGLGRLINRFIGLPSRNHLIRKIRLTGKKGLLETAENPKARYIIVCNCMCMKYSMHCLYLIPVSDLLLADPQQNLLNHFPDHLP